jgi:hypothetical protein
MSKPLPDLMLRGEAYNNNVVASITLNLNYPSSDSEATICSVLFDDEVGLSQVMIRDASSLHSLQIRANHFRDDIWIPSLTVDYSYREHSDQSIHGVAELFVEGNLQDFHSLPGIFKCYVLLQDNALFAFYDDEKPIAWTTKFGQARLSYDYRYGGYIRDMKEQKPLKRPMIEINIDSTKYASLYELISDVAEYLDDLMWLLSFLCKKYVFWYQADMYYEPSEASQGTLRIINLYRNPRLVTRNPMKTKSPGFENQPSDLLIDLDIFRSGAAIEVFKSFSLSEDKSIIKKAITYVLATYGNALLEEKLGTIYAALEGLVNSYTNGKILGKSKFDKLEDAIKHFILSQKSLELTDEQLEEIRSKLPELARKTFTTRLKDLFSEPLEKIAPLLREKYNSETLHEQLKHAVQRRNKYIHQGKVDDLSQSAGDIALIRFLVNLYILKLLGYPIEHINRHDRDLLNTYWALEKQE